MSWIEDATKVLAEGMTPEGKRMQIIAEPVEYSGDLCPDGDGRVPTLYVALDHMSQGAMSGVNLEHFPLDVDDAVSAVLELRDRFRDNWAELAERWFRINGAKGASVHVVDLSRSHGGVIIAAYGQGWQEVTGVVDDYTITDEDTEEFENWLKGDVSRVTAREATHDCNCEYCEVEWVEKADVFGMIVYADPWDIQDGINDKYAYVLDEVIAESEMIQRGVAA